MSLITGDEILKSLNGPVVSAMRVSGPPLPTKTPPTPLAKMASKAAIPALLTDGSKSTPVNPLLVSAIVVAGPPLPVKMPSKFGVPLTPAKKATVPPSLMAGLANARNGFGGRSS
jgi:hypothetical protein